MLKKYYAEKNVPFFIFIIIDAFQSRPTYRLHSLTDLDEIFRKRSLTPTSMAEPLRNPFGALFRNPFSVLLQPEIEYFRAPLSNHKKYRYNL